jgi:hypothetical protein
MTDNVVKLREDHTGPTEVLQEALADAGDMACVTLVIKWTDGRYSTRRSIMRLEDLAMARLILDQDALETLADLSE